MAKIEKAYYTNSINALRDIPPGYSRLYFGAEFCQWRMPGPAAALRAYEAARGAGLAFTLMTPWLTDAGLTKLRVVLKKFYALGIRDIEVVMNDLGALDMLSEFPGLVPVLGRLLVKQRRCPRAPGIIGGLPEDGRDVFLRPGAEDPVSARLLRGMGVRRVELDAPLQGLAVDLRAVKLKGSVYTPYAYVTTTRHCPASFDGETWQAFGGCKLKGCVKNVIALENPAHGAEILMRGNTQFVRTGLPDGLAEMGIDRIVRMGDLP